MSSSTKEKLNNVAAASATGQQALEQQQQASFKSKGTKPWYLLAAQILAWQLMAFLLVEASLFVAGLGEEEIYKIDPVLGFKHMHNKKVTWRSEGFATSFFDSHGLREPGITIAKPAGTLRIALLGDSLTESLQVPVEQSFGIQIQNQLSKELGRPVQVLNFGTSGYSTVQEYLQLKNQVLNFHPDLVLLCYNNRDCFENWSPPDEVLTNVRPAAIHLPGQKLTVVTTPVTQWMKTPRARFLKNVEFLREHSRLWGLWAAAELDWSMHNETYKKFSLFLTRPGKALRLCYGEFEVWLKAFPWGCKLPTFTEFEKHDAIIVQNSPSSAGRTASCAAGVVPAAGEAGQEPAPALKEPTAMTTIKRTSPSSPKSQVANSSPANEKNSSNAPAGRLNYQDLIVRTLGSLFEEMKTSSASSGARFAVVALPVASALSARQGMQTSFNDFDYNDEIKMLEGICQEKKIALLNIHTGARALSKNERDDLFFLVHYKPKGHEFVAKTLSPELKAYIKGEIPK